MKIEISSAELDNAEVYDEHWTSRNVSVVFDIRPTIDRLQDLVLAIAGRLRLTGEREREIDLGWCVVKVVLAAFVLMACSAPPAPFDRTPENAPILLGEPPAPPPPPPAPPEKLPPIRVWISPDVVMQDEVRAGVAGWAESTASVRDWVFIDATADDVNPDDPAANPSPADVAIYQIGPYGGTCAPESLAGMVAETTALACVWGIGGLWHNDSGSAMPVFLIDGQHQSYEQNPTLVVMHEIGHLLGLTHEDGEIMHPYSTSIDLRWECPDARTIASLEKKLDVSGLTSCSVPE